MALAGSPWLCMHGFVLRRRDVGGAVPRRVRMGYIHAKRLKISKSRNCYMTFDKPEGSTLDMGLLTRFFSID